MIIEDRLIRNLPEKSQIDLTDQIIIEDMDGTKLGHVKSLRRLMMNNLIFNTIEDMKCAELVEGDICITMGYHTIGDGGGAMYRIVYEPTAVEDGAHYHYLYGSDVNRAKFISEDGTVTPEQFGAYGDGAHDDYNPIRKCIESPYNYKLNFIQSHTYKVTKMIPLKSGIILDFNMAKITPFGCSAIGISASDTRESLSGVSIRNANIIMANAISSIAIVFDKPMRHTIIENIDISQGGSTAIRTSAVDNLTIQNSTIQIPNVKNGAYGIDIAGTDTPGMDSQLVNICKTRFTNFQTSIAIRLSTAMLNIHIDGCSHDINSNISKISTRFLFNNSTLSSHKKTISINNIQTDGVDGMVENLTGDVINISNVHMNNAKKLFDSSSQHASISLYGSISMISSGETVVDKFPVFGTVNGKLFVNTQNIHFDSERYKERNYDNSNYNCTIFDSADIYSYPITSINIVGNTLQIPFMRNGIISIENSGDTITEITGGIENQVIALKAESARNINNGGTVSINSAPTATTLSKSRVMFLKCISGRWTEIN